MTRIIAVANQKGGVAKTTTTAALGVALAELGRRVLLVDLDPQACLTFSLGVDPDELEFSVQDVLLGRVSAGMSLLTTSEGPELLPANIELAGVESALANRTGREHALRIALDTLVESASPRFDDVLIDCPPSLGVLTVNGLTAARELLIPLQCETLSYRGVGQLLATVADVRRFTNPALSVLGVLPTLFDGRTNHSRTVLADVSSRYGLAVLGPAIAKSVRFAEAPQVGRTALSTSASVPGALAYRAVAARLAAGEVPLMPTVVDLEDSRVEVS